jgi:hypothetical protein
LWWLESQGEAGYVIAGLQIFAPTEKAAREILWAVLENGIAME